MTAVVTQAFELCKKQWILLVLTILIHGIQSFDPGIGEFNFGIVLLLAIPLLLGLIYDFSLTKFIYDKKDKKTLEVRDLKDIFNDYRKLILKLFFPLIAFTLIILIIVGVVSGIVYGIFAMLNIQNEKSLFESGVTDLNYLVIYTLINCTFAFLIYQAPLFFVKKVEFFKALIFSIKIGLKHIPFTLLIGVLYSLVMFTTNLIGNDTWYKNIIIGAISGFEYYFIAAVVLVYYLEHIHDKKVS